MSSVCSREVAIAKFKLKLEQDEAMNSNLITLSDKILGCYCAPLPCHGDVLINAFIGKNYTVPEESEPTR